MNKFDIIDTFEDKERVTSNYAEIYLDDECCDYKPKHDKDNQNVAPSQGPSTSKENREDIWISPSDIMIGKLDLVPPFTSRVHRGITHKGILEIGEAVLQREREKFLKHLAELIAQSDAAWAHIQEEEKKIIEEKVRAIYERIFNRKSAVFQKEIGWFYEDTLRELENHLRCEVRTILMSTHCSMINDLDKEIKEKLREEKMTLEKVLRKKYDDQIKRVNIYYKLLLQKEQQRCNRFLNHSLVDRNEALKAFCNQIEADATTSTMYVMCTERKKCRMRQFLLENFHTSELEEKLKIIKEKQDILDEFQRNKKSILDINREWEEKVEKILQLFLKFISFSLKLLPEQTTFLLDLEKLVVLQLNEIQKHPQEATSILINEDEFKNMFEFQQPEKSDITCEKEPFVIEGDLTPSVSTQYGSRESIPLHKELPSFRVQRQFIYAKCDKFQQVKDLLESQRCKCHDKPKEPSLVESSTTEPEVTPSPQISSESSNELFLVDDVPRLQDCPSKGCKDYINRFSFPNLDDYLDFNEENYARVQAILDKPAEFQPPPKIIDPKEVVFRELPFAATKELYRNMETQCSSQEELLGDLSCNCMEQKQVNQKVAVLPVDPKQQLEEILHKRRESLKKIMHENPKLMNLFSEEGYDFVM